QDREGDVRFELATLDAQAAGGPGSPEDADAVLGHKMAVLQDHLLSGRADGSVELAGRHPAMRERQPSLGADDHTARQEVLLRFSRADLDAPADVQAVKPKVGVGAEPGPALQLARDLGEEDRPGPRPRANGQPLPARLHGWSRERPVAV